MRIHIAGAFLLSLSFGAEVYANLTMCIRQKYECYDSPCGGRASPDNKDWRPTADIEFRVKDGPECTSWAREKGSQWVPSRVRLTQKRGSEFVTDWIFENFEERVWSTTRELREDIKKAIKEADSRSDKIENRVIQGLKNFPTALKREAVINTIQAELEAKYQAKINQLEQRIKNLENAK